MRSVAFVSEKKFRVSKTQTKAIAEKVLSSGGSDSVATSTSMVLERFAQFWDLMDTIKIHGYIRTAMSIIGRSAVGSGWSLVEHGEYGKQATERQRRALYRFYTAPQKNWDNIQDYYSIVFKLMIGVMYLTYFGRAAYKIVRGKGDQAIGMDFLFGFVVPNVDSTGKFKEDGAFLQYTARNMRAPIKHKNARDIVYIVNPDWEGFPGGGTDVEALAQFILPLDIYLLTAARDYLRNRDQPEVMYMLPSDVSDAAFEEFVAQVNERWSGPENVGRSPIVATGEVTIEELRRLPASLPYQEARKDTRLEIQAVTGANSGKMGDAGPSAAMRELRREFHETKMLPLFRMIEQSLYEQVHVREFGFPGWCMKFNSPDFLTAVERATVDMRYFNMSVFNPNEIRSTLGKKPRKDPGGDTYLPVTDPAPENQGSPPEGRPVEPDDPSQVGEPTNDGDDPERGDQHDEETRAILAEARSWRNYLHRRKGRPQRPFVPRRIPEEIAEIIQSNLEQAMGEEQIDAVFAELYEGIREVKSEFKRLVLR